MRARRHRSPCVSAAGGRRPCWPRNCSSRGAASNGANQRGERSEWIMAAQELLRYVELSEARDARGVRMVGVWALPSPWTEAAKGIFHVKEIPVLCVRHKRGDADQYAWAGVQNAPAVFND